MAVLSHSGQTRLLFLASNDSWLQQLLEAGESVNFSESKQNYEKTTRQRGQSQLPLLEHFKHFRGTKKQYITVRILAVKSVSEASESRNDSQGKKPKAISTTGFCSEIQAAMSRLCVWGRGVLLLRQARYVCDLAGRRYRFPCEHQSFNQRRKCCVETCMLATKLRFEDGPRN